LGCLVLVCCSCYFFSCYVLKKKEKKRKKKEKRRETKNKKRRASLTLKALLHKRNMVFSQMKERKPEPYSTDDPIFLAFFCSVLGIGLQKQYCVAGK
jgi:hypothetical protein